MTPWTVAHQAPLYMEFSRQEYWGRLPFPSPGEFSQLKDGTQVSHIAGRCFTTWTNREALSWTGINSKLLLLSELNPPIPVQFSFLIPKISTFTLAISCLTSSNLPWFMDLTFQVPMQYCSLQPQTLLPLPVTSSTGCCFCFGSVSSFFLSYFSTDIQ